MPVSQDSYQRETIEISNITFAILPSYQKKILKLNGHPDTLVSTALDEAIRCTSKWFI